MDSPWFRVIGISACGSCRPYCRHCTGEFLGGREALDLDGNSQMGEEKGR